MKKRASNAKKGKLFERDVQQALENKYKVHFKEQHRMLIGKGRGKAHCFDLVNSQKKIVVECKNYSWTKDGNIPSAKISTLMEALYYMSFLHKNFKRRIVMKRKIHKKHGSLANYFVRLYKPFLGGVKVYEYEKGELREVHGGDLK